MKSPYRRVREGQWERKAETFASAGQSQTDRRSGPYERRYLGVCQAHMTPRPRGGDPNQDAAVPLPRSKP